MFGSTSELRVRLAPLNRFKPSSKIFYWPFQGGTSFVDLLCFCSVLCLLCFVRVCLYVLRGHLLGKGWPLGSRLWCLLWVCHFPIGILGQVWYLIVWIPDLCNLTYFESRNNTFFKLSFFILFVRLFSYGYFNINLTYLNAKNAHVAPWGISISPRVINSAGLVISKFFVTCWLFSNLAFSRKKREKNSQDHFQSGKRSVSRSGPTFKLFAKVICRRQKSPLTRI